MEGCSKNVEACPQLLDLIPKEREWLGKGEDERSSSEDRKLELRLGPPGEDWSLKSTSNRERRERHKSQLLSFGYFTNGNQQTHKFPSSAENSHVWFNKKQQGKVPPSYLNFPSSSTPPTATATQQSLPVMDKESSQPCCTKVVVELPQCAEKKAFSTPAPANTAVPNSSQKRYSSFFTLLCTLAVCIFVAFLTGDIHSHVYSARWCVVHTIVSASMFLLVKFDRWASACGNSFFLVLKFTTSNYCWFKILLALFGYQNL